VTTGLPSSVAIIGLAPHFSNPVLRSSLDSHEYNNPSWPNLSGFRHPGGDKALPSPAYANELSRMDAGLAARDFRIAETDT
jgi:hypothetical protein